MRQLGTSTKLKIQPKLQIGHAHDAAEQEADAVAEQVMRLPLSGATPVGIHGHTGLGVQRQCADCAQEDEQVQRKPLIQAKANAGMLGGITAPGPVQQGIAATRGGGAGMEGKTRGEMEGRFGHNFGGVRIHTGAYAEQLSDQVQARAFTVGNDIYFNRGEYQPGTMRGNMLLAHELVHTVQQGAVGGRIQRQIGCPPRPDGETARSQTRDGILLTNIATTADGMIVQDFGVNSAIMPPGVTTSTEWQTFMSNVAGNPATLIAIVGYSDCTGNDEENIVLREQRVAEALRQMPFGARRRVALQFSTAVSYLATNLTPEGRAQNRAVRFLQHQDQSSTSPCDRIVRASNLDEYIFLIRCAEERLLLTSPNQAALFLSMLRQIYYGTQNWSIPGNRLDIWDRIITDRLWPSADDPRSPMGIGTRLYTALVNSAVVENVDIGHVLAGLDAMLHPHSVPIRAGASQVSVEIAHGARNEEWAGWAGDLGAASGDWAFQSYRARRDLPANVSYRNHASEEDMVGNIDAFAMRLASLQNVDSAASIGVVLPLNRRISDLFLDYYRLTNTTLGRGRSSSIRNFVTAYGGIISGNSITNQQAFKARFRPEVESIGSLWYMRALLTERNPNQSGTDPAPYLQRGIDNILNEFVIWLEQMLSRSS